MMVHIMHAYVGICIYVFREGKKMMVQDYSHTGRFGPGEVGGHILPGEV